jgi:Asp-tRNA(Asn)/Glu-tRNA(Gln) amidotransferase A subunit family amidase
MRPLPLYAQASAPSLSPRKIVKYLPDSTDQRQPFSSGNIAHAFGLTAAPRPHTLARQAMSPVFHSSISRLTASVRSKKVSPVEIVDAFLERAADREAQLNAFVHLDADGARLHALSAEAAVMRGDELGPLHGVPVTVKSCLDAAGWPCPAGSVLRKEYVAAEDAPLVARLRAAGAIVLGNTNTPEFLMAYESNNLLTGKTSNPWDLTRSAGGSSGGEAAAIAAGCSVGGVGSDGGGSIRVPAHFCGICGLKPTPGRVPLTGHFPPGAGVLSWLGAVGPMARTVADVRALFEVLAGPDPGDAQSVPFPGQRVDASKTKNLRIGVLESNALGKATPETQAAVKRAAELLGAQGFALEPFPLTALDRALDVWWFFFGPLIAYMFRPMIGQQDEQITPVFRDYLDVAESGGTPTLDQTLDYRARRDNLRGEILRELRDVPILLSPVCSTPAFRHGEGTWRADAEHGYRDTMRFSQWLNLAGFPAVAVPMAMSPEDLPIGVQVIGRPYEDELVLAVAERLEQARGPWQPPPF